jgi:hypothetical protein
MSEGIQQAHNEKDGDGNFTAASKLTTSSSSIVPLINNPDEVNRRNSDFDDKEYFEQVKDGSPIENVAINLSNAIIGT